MVCIDPRWGRSPADITYIEPSLSSVGFSEDSGPDVTQYDLSLSSSSATSYDEDEDDDGDEGEDGWFKGSGPPELEQKFPAVSPIPRKPRRTSLGGGPGRNGQTFSKRGGRFEARRDLLTDDDEDDSSSMIFTYNSQSSDESSSHTSSGEEFTSHPRPSLKRDLTSGKATKKPYWESHLLTFGLFLRLAPHLL